jgi:hypothetical protein
MLQKIIFSNVLKKGSALALSGALLVGLTSAPSWAMKEDKDDVKNPILFTVFNELDQEDFTMEFACEGKGHKVIDCQSNLFFDFESYEATLKFKSKDYTIVRFNDLPNEIKEHGYSKFYGITSLPAKYGKILIGSLSIEDNPKITCTKHREGVYYLFPIKEQNVKFRLHTFSFGQGNRRIHCSQIDEKDQKMMRYLAKIQKEEKKALCVLF